MVQSKAIDAVANGVCNCRNILAAGHVCPESDAYQAPRFSDHFHGFVADVPWAGAVPLKASMTHYQCGALSRFQRITNGRFAAVRHVDHDIQCLHLNYGLATKGS